MRAKNEDEKIKKYRLPEEYKKYKSFRIVTDPSEMNDYPEWDLLKIIPEAETNVITSFSIESYAPPTYSAPAHNSNATSTAAGEYYYNRNYAPPKKTVQQENKVSYYIFGKTKDKCLKMTIKKNKTIAKELAKTKRKLESEVSSIKVLKDAIDSLESQNGELIKERDYWEGIVEDLKREIKNRDKKINDLVNHGYIPNENQKTKTQKIRFIDVG